MDRFLHPRILLAFATLWLAAGAACGSGAPEGPLREPLDRRAALATLVVENRTSRTLAIRFRYATRPARSVEVGRVAAGATAEMAPVPAQEPIVLEAEGPGIERRTEPRTFEIDAVWTWVIADSTTHEH